MTAARARGVELSTFRGVAIPDGAETEETAEVGGSGGKMHSCRSPWELKMHGAAPGLRELRDELKPPTLPTALPLPCVGGGKRGEEESMAMASLTSANSKQQGSNKQNGTDVDVLM